MIAIHGETVLSSCLCGHTLDSKSIVYFNRYAMTAFGTGEGGYCLNRDSAEHNDQP